MKRLYLIRHAKSSWKNSSLADVDRPLNKRGEKDAPFMGNRLRKVKANPDGIFTSPAKRARKTTKMLAKAMDYPKEKIETVTELYGATQASLFDFIRQLDDALTNVMLIGHNPELTDLANYLTTERVENIPTCGIFCIDFPVDSWKEISENLGTVAFFDYPKKH